MRAGLYFLLAVSFLAFGLDLFHMGFHLYQQPSLWNIDGVPAKRELVEKTGIARDAREIFFGGLKIDPPTGSFPSGMDKISWWGSFKPFEFWEIPEFQAAWINPQGEEVVRQKFRGSKCRLAKTTVRGENQLRGEFQGGIWPDAPAPAKKEEGRIIWAGDAIKNEKR